MKIPPSARMITAVVFVPWEPNSASTAWMSEAVRTTRGDWGSAVPDEADPNGASAGAGDVCAESARLSVEVTVDQYGLGLGSGLARPSQFVTGGRQRRRRPRRQRRIIRARRRASPAAGTWRGTE